MSGRRGQVVFAAAVAVPAAALIALPAAAQDRSDRRVDVAPYIAAEQVIVSDLADEVLTYTALSAGVDASIQTRRVQVGIAYEYQHRIAYDDDLADTSVHSGLARAAVVLAPGLQLEAGGIATRARADSRGGAAVGLAGDPPNVSQVYSGYAGPSLATNAGPIGINAAYRFGYTRVEAPDVPSLLVGQPPIDLYDDATSHIATASAGTRAGTLLPIGVTVSGAWQREDAGQLDQRYDGKYARGDVVLPVGRGVALVAGAGYENIEISQRDALTNAAGDPVRDAAGRFVTDPGSPRRLTYEADGIFWDAGVLYRPNRRLMLEARVGRRYDSWSYTGALNYQVGRESVLQVGVYDSIQSFGRQLNNGLAALPTQFAGFDDPFGGQYNGCIFGADGVAAGGCLNSAFQSIATANYRARGVDAVFAVGRGPLRIGFGAGYSNRRFIAPDFDSGFSVNGVSDEGYYAQAFAQQQMGRYGSLSGNVVFNYYDSGLPGSEGVYGWGVNAAYGQSFGRLGATAAVGLFGGGQGGEADTDSVAAQALLGLRYGF